MLSRSHNNRTPAFDHKTGEAQGEPYYILGGPDGRTTYTGLGEFPSAKAAADAWASKTRSGSGVALIHENREAWRFELNYGIHSTIHATAAAPTWS